jgi:hypothetical protein
MARCSKPGAGAVTYSKTAEAMAKNERASHESAHKIARLCGFPGRKQRLPE